MSHLITLHNDPLTKEGWTELAAIMKERTEARKQREAAVILDPKKEFTGHFDNYCNPIYSDSIICLCSGNEGYWTVFKNEKGEWMKKSIDVDENDGGPTVEPLTEYLDHAEVVEDAKAHAAMLLQDELSGGQCGKCEYRPQCDEEGFARCRACEGE